jgi:hypothetical protein
MSVNPTWYRQEDTHRTQGVATADDRHTSGTSGNANASASPSITHPTTCQRPRSNTTNPGIAHATEIREPPR